MDCGIAVVPVCVVDGPRVRSAVVEGMEERDARAEALREDVADEERWCRRWEGIGCEGPERR